MLQEFILMNFALSTLVVVFFFGFYRKHINYIHFIVFYFFYSHVLRGVGILQNDGSILYAQYFTWDRYLYALNLNLLFFSFFLIAYCIGFGKDRVVGGGRALNCFKVDMLSLIVVGVSLAFSFAIGGVDILAPFREVSISVVNPILRFIYPFTMIFSAILVGRGVLVCVVDKRFLFGFLLFVVGFAGTVIINQRGFMLVFLIVSATYLYSTGHKKFALIALGLSMIFAVTIRLIMYYLLLGSNSGVEKESLGFFKSLPYSADGDASEVWMVVLSFLESHKMLLGESLANVWSSVFSSNFRYETGFKTGLDVLNEYNDAKIYWDSKFGFNVSSSQELYLNFGLMSFLVVMGLGYLAGRVMRQYRKFIISGADPIYSFLIPYAVVSFCLSFGGFVWLVFFMLVCLCLRFVCRSALFGVRA